jgi:predicted AlkP superfamily pyrophosphatase or phosphodiesterase
MKKSFFIAILLLSCSVSLFAQKTAKPSSSPKLVVGMMVDQMRWDYLYRYQHRFGANGFKRVLREGFSCENAFISYAQTVTAAGHASVYTGSVPALNGIMGNDWYDRSQKKMIYCVEDDGVKIVGGVGNKEPMSPKNLTVTTITDELELATNFRSKVIGVAIKDRGSILPAGHAADAAYWYEPGSGNFVSSTWYMKELTPWATAFNQKKIVDSMYALNWNLSFPWNTYVQSNINDPAYAKAPFPRKLDANIGKNYGAIASTPWGNTLTLEFSKAAVDAEKMGADSVTDFLAISLSSPDYIGHAFGPNSVEVEDNYIKLDQELASFFDYLDKKVGKGNYIFFLTADHGVAHVPAYMNENKLPAKSMKSNKKVEAETIKKFGLSRLIESQANNQFYLDKKYLDSLGADYTAVKHFFINELKKDDDVLTAFDNDDINAANLPAEYKEMFQKGYNQKLAGDVQVVYKSNYFFGAATGSTHGTMYPYDAHIPLLWMGWGVNQGKTNRKVYMSDIAGTLAAILKVQMPSGNVGTVIHEVVK